MPDCRFPPVVDQATPQLRRHFTDEYLINVTTYNQLARDLLGLPSKRGCNLSACISYGAGRLKKHIKTKIRSMVECNDSRSSSTLRQVCSNDNGDSSGSCLLSAMQGCEEYEEIGIYGGHGGSQPVNKHAVRSILPEFLSVEFSVVKVHRIVKEAVRLRILSITYILLAFTLIEKVI